MDESGLKGEHLKEMGQRAKEEMRRKFNQILAGGQVPAAWKEAKVVLLHKGGDRKNLRNYRPVTIVDQEYKVL